MKKFLCLLLCLMVCTSTAFAADLTAARKFRNQFIVGGNGIKGTMSITASGAAPWLEYLLPFTAAEMQVRVIGHAQGKYSDLVTDDDAWQAQLFAEDAQGNAHAMTRLYGDPAGIYLTSELLPDTLLRLPVENVQLPHALVEGEYASLFLAFDPFGLMNAEPEGNASSYSALAELMQIPEAEWAEKWAPVLEKYDTELELWLTGYATSPEVTGGTGALTIRTTYSIPGEDVKAEAKKIIGMMLYDHDLMALVKPYFAPIQQSTYLNPDLVYFYEHCIDLIPLNGKIIMESELSAMGEAIRMSISLPLPKLPEELTAPAGELLASLFKLPYTDVLANIDRVSYTKESGDSTLSVSSPARTISFTVSETAEMKDGMNVEGFVRIDPAAGSSEPRLSAAFAYKTAHAVQNEDSGAQYDDTSVMLSIVPDLSMLDEDDPFRSRYIDFGQLGFDLAFKYYTKDLSAERATRLQIMGKVQMPDAEIGIDADLRTGPKWEMENLITVGAENVLTLSDERKANLLETLLSNAIGTMVQLNMPTAEPEEMIPDVTTETDLTVPGATPVPPLEPEN